MFIRPTQSSFFREDKYLFRVDKYLLRVAFFDKSYSESFIIIYIQERNILLREFK